MANDRIAEHGRATRFKPGNPGGPGRPRQKPWLKALMAAIERRESASPNAMIDLAEQLLKQVERGDIPAIKELADRLDGKVPQTHAGDDDADPITVRTIVTGVARADDGEAQ